MRSDLLLLFALFNFPLAAQVPGQLQANTQSLHIAKQTQPGYPAIARLAHVSGEVKLRLTIGPDGHVTSSQVLSGPPMLIGAAKDCVQEWIYTPVASASGEPETATTVVSLMFNLNAPGHRPDEKLAQHFYPLQRECIAALYSKQDAAHQAESCTRAAQAAEAFDPGERFNERRTAFTYASIALSRNNRPQQALDYANKAVLTAQQGHDDGEGLSEAYSARAQAEAVMGNLPKAFDDISMAEQDERSVIEQAKTTAPDLIAHKYVPTLKYILDLEARILTAMGKPAEAAAKTAEAAKL